MPGSCFLVEPWAIAEANFVVQDGTGRHINVFSTRPGCYKGRVYILQGMSSKRLDGSQAASWRIPAPCETGPAGERTAVTHLFSGPSSSLKSVRGALGLMKGDLLILRRKF